MTGPGHFLFRKATFINPINVELDLFIQVMDFVDEALAEAS